MAVEVMMPKVDMDQEAGTIIRWLKENGDEVKKGEIILEIETDKVAIEVESPASGILNGIRVGEGETVPIATTIAYILETGESLPSGLDQMGRQTQKKPVPKKLGQQPERGAQVTPLARKVAAVAGIDPVAIPGTGRGGKVTRKDVEGVLAERKSFTNGEGKVYATPAARRLAAERGLLLAAVRGSGPNGRVQATDVLSSSDAVEKESGSPVADYSKRLATEVVPLEGMRRVIAERLTVSYQSVPHINFSARIDMTRFNEIRAQLNARSEREGGAKVSATALLVKIVGQTLIKHPWLNSSFHEGSGTREAEIHLIKDINIGIAVALEDGLIVPVLHDVPNKDLAQIALEVKDLVTRAREGRLVPAEVRDGTFSVSNLGPFGVEQFTAIINPPQAAILAVGATKLEVVPDADGEIVIRPIMRITLTADHRVVDGAVAANFIADLRATLEEPVLLLL